MIYIPGPINILIEDRAEKPQNAFASADAAPGTRFRSSNLFQLQMVERHEDVS